jgi:hypothetical protein
MYPSWHHKWATRPEKYKTIEEAKAAFEKLPIKTEHRIMEEYTVTRYKAVNI